MEFKEYEAPKIIKHLIYNIGCQISELSFEIKKAKDHLKELNKIYNRENIVDAYIEYMKSLKYPTSRMYYLDKNEIKFNPEQRIFFNEFRRKIKELILLNSRNIKDAKNNIKDLNRYLNYIKDNINTIKVKRIINEGDEYYTGVHKILAIYYNKLTDNSDFLEDCISNDRNMMTWCDENNMSLCTVKGRLIVSKFINLRPCIYYL